MTKGPVSRSGSFRWALAPLSWLYGASIGYRNRRYDQNSSLARRLPVSVLSVGNLTTGGSGKTPLVAALARELLSRGLPVAVLSRGYGRPRSSAPFVLVSDGKRISASPEESGDEPYELAESVPGLAVAVGADRFEAGRKLIDQLGPHMLLLDDGFQHRRLHRDLDLVCLDAEEPESSFRLLPAGRLREPLRSLARADALVWTRWREGRRSEALRAAVRAARPDLVEIRTRHRIVGLRRIDGGRHRQGGGDGGVGATPTIAGAPVGVLLGVARPQRVLDSLEPLGAKVAFRALRNDHYWWTEAEVRSLAEKARRAGATALLTTGKDAVKMQGVREAGTEAEALALPLFVIRIETEVLDPDRPSLHNLLDRLSTP